MQKFDPKPPQAQLIFDAKLLQWTDDRSGFLDSQKPGP